MLKGKIIGVLVSLLILFACITSYAIWGDSGLIIALIIGIGLEAWFWYRIIPNKRKHNV